MASQKRDSFGEVCYANPMVLPNDEEMLRLKRELNFLLWTDDVVKVPEGFPTFVAHPGPLEPAKVNFQCGAHSTVTGAIFMRRGLRVTTRGGMAWLIENSADGDPRNSRCHEIGKHWWFTLDNYGLVDLSLKGEAADPLIYCNRSFGNRWQVVFGYSAEKLRHFLDVRQQGCFYLTLTKNQPSLEQLAHDLEQAFPPARQLGIMLSYRRIVEHAEGVLLGRRESIIGLGQTRAWEKLAE